MMACVIKETRKVTCLNTSIKYGAVRLQVNHPRQDTQHSILRKTPVSRRLQDPQSGLVFCPDERKSLTLIFVFHAPDWQMLPCATEKCFGGLKAVQMCTQYFNVYCCLLVIN